MQVVRHNLRVSDPLRVRRPRDIALVSLEVIVFANVRQFSAACVEHPQLQTVITKGQQLRIRRPRRIEVIRRLLRERKFLHLSAARLARHMHGIQPRLIRKISQRLPVRRPCRTPLHHARCIGNIPCRPLLRRYRENFPMRLKHGAQAGRRDPCMLDLRAHIFDAGTHFRQIAHHIDRHHVRLTTGRIV